MSDALAGPTVHSFAAPPAGWYPDPAGSPGQRWWDGRQWTTAVQQPARPGAHRRPRNRLALAGLAAVVLAAGGAGAGAAWAYDAPAPANTAGAQPAATTVATDPAVAAQADTSAKSDVRGALSSVEQYYSEYGGYPATPFAGDNTGGALPQIDLGGETPGITLSDGTRLYYVPSLQNGAYRICATNAAGTGNWYFYDGWEGGAVSTVSLLSNPETCQ